MKRIILPSLACLLAGILSSCEDEPSFSSEGDFLPLADGMEWVYENYHYCYCDEKEYRKEGEWKLMVKGDTIIDGYRYAKLYREEFGFMYLSDYIRKEDSRYFKRFIYDQGDKLNFDSSAEPGTVLYSRHSDWSKYEIVLVGKHPTFKLDGKHYRNVLHVKEVWTYAADEAKPVVNETSHYYAAGLGEIKTQLTYDPYSYGRNGYQILKSYVKP